MAVEAVKNYSVSSQQPTVIKKNLKPEQNAQSIPETDKEKSNAAKYMIGATVLAGIAAIGIYLATRGKSGRATEEVIHDVASGKSGRTTEEVIHDVANNTQETVNTITEMTFDAFKKAGNKFNKSRAVTSTGEGFTGKISYQTKNGKDGVLEYENGILKLNKYNGEKIFYYDEKCALKGVKHDFRGKDGIVYHDRILYSSDGSRKMKIRYSGYGGFAIFYDKNGVPVDKIHADMLRMGNDFYYQGLSFHCGVDFGIKEHRYLYTTPQGVKGTIYKYKRPHKGIETSLFLENLDGGSYVISKKGKDIQIRRNGKGKEEFITNDSDEYKYVLAQSSDFVKQFFAKYKTALGLQRQVYEGNKIFRD